MSDLVYSNSNNFGVEAKFIFDKDNSDQNIEQLNYNLIEFPTPTRTLNAVDTNRKGDSGNIPGDRIINEPLVSIRFIVDEDMRVLFALYDLQEKYRSQGKSEDILSIQKLNNDNKVVANASYKKAWISNISGLLYEPQGDTTITYLDVLIGYQGFDIKPN